MDHLQANSFWAFACQRRLRLTSWGDYLRLVGAGMISPPEVRSWPELWSAIGVLRGFSINKTEAHVTWRAYLQRQRELSREVAAGAAHSDDKACLLSRTQDGDAAAARELARRVHDMAQAEATMARLLDSAS